VVAVWRSSFSWEWVGLRNWWLRLGCPVLLVVSSVFAVGGCDWGCVSPFGLSADCVGSRRASPGGLDPRGPRDSWHRLQFSFCQS
jgi:hypothetical protein